MNSELQPDLKTDIVILGAGIGGYETFRTLSKQFKKYRIQKHITIVDQNNYFSFTPLNHEVASGAVEPTHAALPLRELVYKTPHTFLKAKVLSVDPVKKIVTTDHGNVSYDYCVVAMGSMTNFYGTPGAEENAYQARTLAGAMVLRHNLIELLEDEKNDLNLTVVGGGYTGVEMAGELQHLVNHDLRALYPEKKVSVRLIQTIGTVVPQLPVKAQQKIVKRLKKMGVEIVFNTAVKEVKKNAVIVEIMTAPTPPMSPPASGEFPATLGSNKSTLAGGAQGGVGTVQCEELPSDFTIWCAGFGNIANCFLTEGFCTKDHRIPTNSFLQHPTSPSLYALGDIALVSNPGETSPLPQLGEVAYHEGHYVGNHIMATLRGQALPAFRFSSHGTLMPIGEGYGIGIIHGVIFEGLFAWWLRRTVYLTFMPGILRKFKIVVDWTLRLFGFRYIIAVERNHEHGPKNV